MCTYMCEYGCYKDDKSRYTEYVLEVGQTNAYASEAYSFNLNDTSGEHAENILGAIPEANSGVTREHILVLMFECEKLGT